MAHNHQHGHRHGSRRRLALTFGLTVAYMIAEVIGGLASGSLALLADAGHMLSDSVALGLALVAAWLAERPKTLRRTYGYGRTEVLAAFANGAILFAVAVGIVGEAVERLDAPTPIDGPVAVGVAAGGLVMNLVAMRILHHSGQSTINERGALLHVLSDALGSVGALVAGSLAWGAGWRWPDPVASLMIAALVLFSAFTLLRETVGVLMESVPGHLDLAAVGSAVWEVDTVEHIHDLHIWMITSHQVCLSAHVVTESDDPAHVLDDIHKLLRERFSIEHSTIQLEDWHYASEHCASCCHAPPSAQDAAGADHTDPPWSEKASTEEASG